MNPVAQPERRLYLKDLNRQKFFVPLGSDVTWTNEDDLAHTINSGMKGYGLYEYIQNGTSNSGKLNKRESFSFHFDKLGTYEYFCIPHPWMSGAIIVE